MKTTFVDLSKANSEFERMARGEIPFDPDYLKELVETSDDSDIEIDFIPTCECGEPAQVVQCNECKILPRKDCPLCDGGGWFFDCFKCNGDGGVKP